MRLFEVRQSLVARGRALGSRSARTLLCADALGTLPFFRAGDEAIGVHPLLRLVPAARTRAVELERVLVGHGAGLDANAAPAVREAIATAPRRRLPRAWLAAISAVRSASAASR